MTTTRAVIIGTGFSGIAMAIALQKAGIDDFVILEKAQGVGGTWRENTYPGAECDIPSALYSYSFEHNAQWQYKWSEQPQILEYLKNTAQKYALLEHIRFGEEVVSAHFDEAGKQWHVESETGGRWISQFLITAVGQLHHPFIPVIPGQDEFKGVHFHSACWDHSVDLNGKSVAVIGNAASALQFIPQIAPLVKQLTVIQRSANWVIPKLDRPYKPWEQWLSDKVPLVTRLYRLRLWLRNELLVYPVMKGNRFLQFCLRLMHMRYLKQRVADSALREKLIPDYPLGAKRILFSDDYFDALVRPNVELLTGQIAQMTESSLMTTDGRQISVDAVIYGTGFKTNPFLAPMDICGIEGRSLQQVWQGGAHAYLGVCTSGFPNFFMLYGPNTNLGHNSIVLMVESQANYIGTCIKDMAAKGGQSMTVIDEFEQGYNEELQRRLRATVWNSLTESWYKDGTRITNNWAGSAWEYMRRLKRVDWAAFKVA
ncbi:MAG: cation diffusion facilitator CzcD-associated flavoprotein CzcO [Bermanella sp.]|jgi:cation diffusion facilitator CzcD-associated flavoprotein CzcO